MHPITSVIGLPDIPVVTLDLDFTMPALLVEKAWRTFSNSIADSLGIYWNWGIRTD